MKKSTLLKTGVLTLFVAAASAGITSCDEEVLAAIFGWDSTNINQHTGYDWDEEDLSQLEDDINIVTIVDDDDSPLLNDLPGDVNLTNYLPPIGDQGQYGTCVAWASAYNGRTYLYARENNLTKSQLESASNQFSPKFIFYALNNRTSCDGSYFEEVLDLIQSTGVATMQSMPYENLGSCTGNPSSSNFTNAANYKIKSYREIDIRDPKNIKSYLNAGKIIIFGAQLGDEFMLADDGLDYLYQQTSYNYSGMHANHAMVCAGYDESRGPNGCFLVVNSWGKSWGNQGYIWVDQNYFCSSEFAFCGFVLNGFNESPLASDNKTLQNTTAGIDLIPTSLSYNDYYDEEDPDSDDPLWRNCEYDVYNAGTSTISASNDWGICLLYYNAYNANDYGVLLVDYYSDDKGTTGDVEGSWDEDEARNYLGIQSQGYCWNNIDVSGASSVAAQVYGDPNSIFSWDFRMPEDLNGQYYIVLAADAFASIDESNEDNNYLYFTAANNKPLNFVNGIATNVKDGDQVRAKAQKKYRPNQNDPSPCQTMVTEDNLNTYSTDEISALLNAEKKSGRLKAKAMQWQKSQAAHLVTAKAKHKANGVY